MKRIMTFVLCVLLLCGCKTDPAAASLKASASLKPGQAVPVKQAPEIDPSSNTNASPNPLTKAVAGSMMNANRSRDNYDVSKLSYADFDIFITFLTDGIPQDANYPSLSYMPGTWKYDLWLFDESDGYNYDELGYAEVSINKRQDNVTLVLHPRIGSNGEEAWYESDEEIGYEPFNGFLDEAGGLKLTGNDAVIYIMNYFAYSGREYVMGTINQSNIDTGFFWMYRGQD